MANTRRTEFAEANPLTRNQQSTLDRAGLWILRRSHLLTVARQNPLLRRIITFSARNREHMNKDDG